MAGTAPPVMLMICRLVCGPSVKREKGIETEMPCCRMKFELSNRKKTSRKATSINPINTSHPKLKCTVRLSFIRDSGERGRLARSFRRRHRKAAKARPARHVTQRTRRPRSPIFQFRHLAFLSSFVIRASSLSEILARFNLTGHLFGLLKADDATDR